MPFTGSCHCGRIAYTLDEDVPDKGIACNCSHCRRKGYLLHFSTPDKFTLDGAQEDIGTYLFNRHVIEHHFCTTCGCAPYAEGKGPDGKPMVAINLRCAEGVDLETLTIVPYDGASK